MILVLPNVLSKRVKVFDTAAAQDSINIKIQYYNRHIFTCAVHTIQHNQSPTSCYREFGTMDFSRHFGGFRHVQHTPSFQRFRDQRAASSRGDVGTRTTHIN